MHTSSFLIYLRIILTNLKDFNYSHNSPTSPSPIIYIPPLFFFFYHTHAAGPRSLTLLISNQQSIISPLPVSFKRPVDLPWEMRMSSCGVAWRGWGWCWIHVIGLLICSVAFGIMIMREELGIVLFYYGEVLFMNISIMPIFQTMTIWNTAWGNILKIVFKLPNE